MSVGNVFTLHSVVHGSNIFDGITDQKIAVGLEEVTKRGDGSVDPTFTAIMSGKPMLSWTTVKVASALGLCGIGGLAIATGNCSFFLKKRAASGIYAGTSSHLKVTGSTGLIVPKTLKVSQGKEATIDYEAHLVSADGTTSPLAIATSQSLTGSPTVDELFTLGPATFNGSAWGGVQDLTIDFGIKVETKAGDGQVWPTFVSIAQREPKITLKGLDASLLSTLTVNGAAISSTTTVKLLGIEQNARRNGSDVLLTIAEGRVHVSDIGGGEDGDQSVDVTITPTYDGTNDIVALTLP